jgi:hypothetical protein
MQRLLKTQDGTLETINPSYHREHRGSTIVPNHLAAEALLGSCALSPAREIREELEKG